MERVKRELTQGDMELMGLPREFWGASWSFLPEGVTKKMVFEYLKSLNSDHKVVRDGDGFFIRGAHGSGKTYLTSICCKAFRRYSYSVYFITANQLQEAAENGIEWDEGTSVLDHAKNVDVLAIDDVGAEILLPKQTNFILEVIAHRKAWRKVLIFNTSLTEAKDLNEKYGAGFIERVTSFMLPIQTQDAAFYRDQGSRLREKYAAGK